MANSVDLAKQLDKDFEAHDLKDLLKASPAALAGITDAKADLLKQALGIKTLEEMGTNKYFLFAQALVALQK